MQHSSWWEWPFIIKRHQHTNMNAEAEGPPTRFSCSMVVYVSNVCKYARLLRCATGGIATEIPYIYMACMKTSGIRISTQREVSKHTHTHTGTHRDKHRHRQTHRHRQKQTHTHRQTHSVTNRDKLLQTHKHTQIHDVRTLFMVTVVDEFSH